MKKLMKSLLSLSMFLAMTACSSADNLQLLLTEVTVEYGESLSLDPKEYLVEDTSEDILSDTKVEVFAVEDDKKDEDPIETDGSDLEVGNYILSLSYNDEVEDVNVTVSDTTAPEFVDFNETVTFVQGESTDLTQLFKTNDLSAVEVTVEGNVDFNTAGTYPIKVTAKDEYENATEKDCSIVITEKEVAVNTPNTAGGSSGGSSSSNSSAGSSNSSTNSGSNNSSNTGGSTGSSGSSSSGSSNTGSSGSDGSTTTPPSQPAAHTHVWVDDWGTVISYNSELFFDNRKDAEVKADELANQFGSPEFVEKYGYPTNYWIKRVHCSVCEDQGVWLEKAAITFDY